MLPAPPKLPFAEVEVDASWLEESPLPLREGAGEPRPRSRGWRSVR